MDSAYESLVADYESVLMGLPTAAEVIERQAEKFMSDILDIVCDLQVRLLLFIFRCNFYFKKFWVFLCIFLKLCLFFCVLCVYLFITIEKNTNQHGVIDHPKNRPTLQIFLIKYFNF